MSGAGRIAVVGGGLIGAAAALALHRAGFDVRLFERSPGPPDPTRPGRPIAVSPAGEHLLFHLGAWLEEDAPRRCAYRRMHVWETAPAALTFDAAAVGWTHLGHIVDAGLLQARLLAQLERAAPEAVCWAAEAVEWRAEEGGGVLRLADGRRGRAHLLVLADGGASALAERLGIAYTGRDYEQQALTAVVRFERGHGATARQRFLPEGPLALLPLPEDAVALVWSQPAESARRRAALDEGAFAAELEAASDGCLGRVREIGPRALAPLALRLAHGSRAARAVLIGDAAHRIHPLAGQGANLGLLDVARLAGALAPVARRGADPGGAAVLDGYARSRDGENRAMAWACDRLWALFGARHGACGSLRRLGLLAVDAAAPLKRALIRQAAGLHEVEADLVRDRSNGLLQPPEISAVLARGLDW